MKRARSRKTAQAIRRLPWHDALLAHIYRLDTAP
jgi:hypothetical protein